MLLWLLQPALNVAVAVFMYRRKLHARFPLFFTFQIFHAAEVGLMIGLAEFSTYRAYFYAFWPLEAVAIVLSFANIHELFNAMFRQREGLRDFGNMLFRWALVVMLLMAIILATANAGEPSQSHYITVVLSLERSLQFMMLGLVLFLLGFSNHLGIRRGHPVFGFVMGWGIVSTVELMLYAERARTLFSDRAFNLLHLAGYDAMLMTWLFYAVAKPAAEVLPNMLLRSQRWSEVLAEKAVSPEEESTLLIGIEALVEQALSRAEQAKT